MGFFKSAIVRLHNFKQPTHSFAREDIIANRLSQFSGLCLFHRVMCLRLLANLHFKKSLDAAIASQLALDHQRHMQEVAAALV